MADALRSARDHETLLFPLMAFSMAAELVMSHCKIEMGSEECCKKCVESRNYCMIFLIQCFTDQFFHFACN